MRGHLADLPPGLVLALAALFGVAVGSFLNVCIYRVPRDLSVVRPRSFCPGCEVPVAWYDNIPLLSFLLLRGRCRYCSEPIGLSYLLVEAITAITFVAVVSTYGVSLAAAKWMVYECLLIILFWTDWQERILPDEFTIGGAAFGLAFAFLVFVPGILGELFFGNRGWRSESIANAAIGGLFASVPIWLLGFLYEKLRGREGLGLGDVKLLFLLGAFLGPENALSALILGATAGAIFGIVQLLIGRKDAWTYALPFGSFLCAAGYLIPLFSPLHLTSLALPRTG
jgi:leader peptidase (prepilin peptidase)/N-methyltransferase